MSIPTFATCSSSDPPATPLVRWHTPAGLRRCASAGRRRAGQLSDVHEALSEPAVAGAELAEEQSEDPPARRRRICRFPVVWQVDEMDCGAACMTAICRYFGRNVPLTFVRDAVGTGLDGTSLRGLANGAHRLGLDAKPLKASKSRLDSLPLPTICHWKGNHWLVLTR